MRMTVKTEQLLQDGGPPEYVYHDRTARRCAVFVGRKYDSKGYPQKQPQEFYAAGFQGLVKRWDERLNLYGDYVEK